MEKYSNPIRHITLSVSGHPKENREAENPLQSI